MENISRRRFVKMLAGVPLLGVTASQLSATTQHDSLSRSQIEAVELILRRLVDAGAVPGVSYSIGNRTETLVEGAFGLRVIAPRTQMERVTRCPIASVSKQFVSAGAYLLQEKGRSPEINACSFTLVTAHRFPITTVTKSSIIRTRRLYRSISTGATDPLT